MEIHTIGFTKRTAEDFFGSLKRAGVGRLIDVRLNNTSQLAAFAKRDDLRYFLDRLLGAEYLHLPELAPSGDDLRDYRAGRLEWSEYERRFIAMMSERSIDTSLDWQELLAVPAVLLCSESAPTHCHRRLIVEYLVSQGLSIDVTHL